jgi:membrane protein YdbS with pleckstrin-like domain
VQVWTVGWALGAAVLTAAVLVGEVLARHAGNLDLPGPTGSFAVALALAATAAVAVLPRLAFRRWRYELAPTTLALRRGVIVHTDTAIPYFRVQHVDITRSPVERALGLSQLVVRTAAATTDAVLPGVAAAEAEALRDQILARAGRDDL